MLPILCNVIQQLKAFYVPLICNYSVILSVDYAYEKNYTLS